MQFSEEQNTWGMIPGHGLCEEVSQQELPPAGGSQAPKASPALLGARAEPAMCQGTARTVEHFVLSKHF